MAKLALLIAALFSYAQAVYFMAQPDTWRCFIDTIVSNYTLEMEVVILEENVLDQIVQANDLQKAQGYVPNHGVHI